MDMKNFDYLAITTAVSSTLMLSFLIHGIAKDDFFETIWPM